MIIYETDQWAAVLAVNCRGSVVPKTLLVAGPAGLFAGVICVWFQYASDLPQDVYESSRTDQFLGTFTSVLGFLIIFRTRIAYSRFWEAASFLQTIRGGWLNVVSACCAFCSTADDKVTDVYEFQHTLVRLVSLMYASALHEVAVMKDNSFEILDCDCFDEELFNYMQGNSKKVEILMQWVQRLIIDGQRHGTLDVPPPILSRVFQELANGVIDLSNAKRICRYPFPFPYAQIQSLLLLFHWGISVWIAGTTMESPLKSFILAFVSTFCLWSMHYTSLEIEQPYGDDMNDLPLDTMQTSLNDSLVNLLHPMTQSAVSVRLNECDDIQCKLWSTTDDPNKRLKDREKKSGQRKTAKKYQVMGLHKTMQFRGMSKEGLVNAGEPLESPADDQNRNSTSSTASEVKPKVSRSSFTQASEPVLRKISLERRAAPKSPRGGNHAERSSEISDVGSNNKNHHRIPSTSMIQGPAVHHNEAEHMVPPISLTQRPESHHTEAQRDLLDFDSPDKWQA